MLSQKNKWVGQNNDELITNFNNASKNHYDDLTSFEWNSKFNDAKSPESLGVNKFGKTVVYKDAPLSEANKARTAAHETGHYYKNTFEEGKDWNSFFDFSLQKQKTRDYLGGKGMRGRGHIKGDEIRERAAQLKDYIAHKNGIPANKDFTVTDTQLDDAISNYVKDTGLDNTMSPMLNSLKDKKGFLKAINKYALGVTPIAGASYLTTQGQEELPQQQQGGLFLTQDGYLKRVIEDDRGQWSHPGEITRINGGNITMQGVSYPVIGVSDKGEQKMMYPNKNYRFNNANYVTEFPQNKK